MIGTLTGRPVTARIAGSLAAAVLAVERGAALVRAHDVAETVDALAVLAALRAAQASGGTVSGAE
jgi:dihydropteroate synthase